MDFHLPTMNAVFAKGRKVLNFEMTLDGLWSRRGTKFLKSLPGNRFASLKPLQLTWWRVLDKQASFLLFELAVLSLNCFLLRDILTDGRSKNPLYSTGHYPSGAAALLTIRKSEKKEKQDIY